MELNKNSTKLNRKTEELKPCPFCGGTDLHLEGIFGPEKIVCYECLAVFSQAESICEEDLIEAWNRRMGDSEDGIQEWISTSERLPEKQGMYLVTVLGDTDFCWWNGDEWGMYSHADKWSECPSDEVEAWRELPEPWPLTIKPERKK